jgi:hypothetical protein
VRWCVSVSTLALAARKQADTRPCAELAVKALLWFYILRSWCTVEPHEKLKGCAKKLEMAEIQCSLTLHTPLSGQARLGRRHRHCGTVKRTDNAVIREYMDGLSCVTGRNESPAGGNVVGVSCRGGAVDITSTGV